MVVVGDGIRCVYKWNEIKWNDASMCACVCKRIAQQHHQQHRLFYWASASVCVCLLCALCEHVLICQFFFYIWWSQFGHQFSFRLCHWTTYTKQFRVFDDTFSKAITPSSSNFLNSSVRSREINILFERNLILLRILQGFKRSERNSHIHLTAELNRNFLIWASHNHSVSKSIFRKYRGYYEQKVKDRI